jgi:hypothetical protein
MEQYDIESKTNYRQALEKNILIAISKQTNEWIIIIIITVIAYYKSDNSIKFFIIIRSNLRKGISNFLLAEQKKN